MSSSSWKAKQHASRRNYLLVATAVIFVVVLVAVTSWSPKNKNKLLEVEPKNSAKIKESSSAVTPTIDLKTSSGGISYYHCNGMGQGKQVNLVLLHGARFTKEDWKTTSGILNDVCTRPTTEFQLSVFAVDLPTKADYQDLMAFFDSLPETIKPVSLVTPSASGRTMVTWAASSTVQETLGQYIQHWIPVAANAINTTPEKDIQNLKQLPILAIYGNRDTAGKQSSERLQTYANAQALELQGGHPCYLDSPKEFVNEVLKFLAQNQ